MRDGNDRNRAAILLTGAAASAGLLAGCFDPVPGAGGAPPQALRREAYHPGCMEPTHLLVLDEDAIDNGCARNRFHSREINDDIASVGLRKPLPFFSARPGQEVVLPAGSLGDEGWFALKTARVSWRDAGPDSGDGFRNYLESGPGLGSPDARGHRESLLDKVPDLTPLRATGLAKLEGRSVCAVVLDRDAKITAYSPLSGDLRGANLGKVAFQVLGLEMERGRGSGDRLPGVRVRILDPAVVCEDPLTAFVEAPAPRSDCEPRDLVPPACAVNQVLLNEPWDFLDPLKWSGDGEGEVSGGVYFARDGSRSSIAGWINPCPLRIDSSVSVRLSNRVQLSLPEENDFAESGAVFFVAGNDPDAFEDYAFLTVGYTTQPSRVFVEVFGSDGGRDFDQFTETSLDYSPSLLFNLDLWVDRGSYRVAVGGEAVDTVPLLKPLSSLSLVEVGVQQNSGGLRGLLDHTSVTRLCAAEGKLKPRSRDRCEPRTRCRRKTDRTRHAKADHSRCHHASYARQGKVQDGKGSRLAKAGRIDQGARTSPNPCGRNDLIRGARERVRMLANPPRSLLILSRMEELPGCEG